MNPADLLKLLTTQPDRELLWTAQGPVTAAQLLAQAQGFIDWARPADARIGLELPNGVQLVSAYLGALLADIPIVPLGTLSPSDRDYILATAKVGAVASPGAWGPVEPKAETWASTWRTDRPWAVFFTSGTTGRPKGVCHHATTLLRCAAAFNAHNGLDEACRMLHVMPMTYMAGVLNTLLCPLLAGGSVVLGDVFSAQHAPALWSSAIQGRANTVWFTPTMAALLARLSRDPSTAVWTRENLRQVFVGTAPLPADTAARFLSVFGVPCLESYGLSELLFITCNQRNDNQPGTVGSLIAGAEVSIEGAVHQGEEGQVLVTTNYAMIGYLDPETGGYIPGTRPFPTGDIGKLTADGKLMITGRIKDLIIRGGANISPRAIEEVLLDLPGVADAAVVAKKHAFWGEEPVAFIVADAASKLDSASLLSACSKRIVRDNLPVAFHFLEALPRSSNGKILKTELRRLAEQS